MTQPLGSKLCGHCCLATLLGITLEQAIALIGHQKGTKTRELTRHFAAKPTKRGVPTGNITALCIARPAGRRAAGNWHWLLYRGGLIYDPEVGEYLDNTHLQISSYAEVVYAPIQASI